MSILRKTLLGASVLALVSVAGVSGYALNHHDVEPSTGQVQVIQAPVPLTPTVRPVIPTPVQDFPDQSEDFRSMSESLGIHNSVDISRWISSVCIRNFGLNGTPASSNDDNVRPMNADEVEEVGNNMRMYFAYLQSHNPELIEPDLQSCYDRMQSPN